VNISASKILGLLDVGGMSGGGMGFIFDPKEKRALKASCKT